VWLGQNATKGKLSPNTIKRNFTDLKQFFGWSVERGYIEGPPKFPKLRGDGNRRPHFDYKDWRKLTRHLREFIKVKDPKQVAATLYQQQVSRGSLGGTNGSSKKLHQLVLGARVSRL
jgi:hypothetical protein